MVSVGNVLSESQKQFESTGKSQVVGVAGYGRAGKDTLVRGLLRGGMFKRYAFADELKNDLDEFILQNYGFSAWTDKQDEKDIIRPLLVAHGAGKRAQDEDHWLNIVAENFNQGHHVAISDCRYYNEIRGVVKHGGIWVYIERPGVEPANDEEERSFAEVFKAVEQGRLPKPIKVINDGKITNLVNRGELLAGMLLTSQRVDLEAVRAAMLDQDVTKGVDKLAEKLYNSGIEVEASMT